MLLCWPYYIIGWWNLRGSHWLLRREQQHSSQFHTRVLWHGGIKVHGDLLPKAMFWREMEMRAAEGEGLTSLWVRPLRCHRPPTAHRGCFYLNLADRSSNASSASPGASPGILTPEEQDQAEDEGEAGKCYNDEHRLCVHRLSPLPEVQGGHTT